jgi:nicotinate dehydrogenase subunit B
MSMPELQLDRRGFLASLGGGVLVCFSAAFTSRAQESGGHRHRQEAELPQNISAWLHIAPDGTITAFTGKVEVGQNIRTSLTQAVADELRCAPAAVELIMGDTASTPWDMGTFGSRTTPTMAPVLRRMAAPAREKLVDAAAQKWQVDRSSLRVANARVLNDTSGKSASFGELAASIDWVHTIGSDDCVTAPDKWQVAGTSVPKLNARDFVTGKHEYTSDHKLPGMLYGRVLRPPSFGAKLFSVDSSAAARIQGVTIAREGDFIGVAAPDEQLAERAAKAIDAKWQEHAQISSNELLAYIRSNGGKPQADGPVEAALQGAHKSLNATYTIAYIAHTPLEPRAAVAQWKNGKLTVWTGTQRPFGVRSELAQAFAMPEDQVRVIMPDTGSAYGGKHTGECAIEAARLAKASGKPVKVIWTREEEFTWAYFRPAGVIDVKSGVTKDGSLAAGDFHNYLYGPSGLDTP